jgi:hypothetical protein
MLSLARLENEPKTGVLVSLFVPGTLGGRFRSLLVIFQKKPQRYMDPVAPGRFGVGIANVPTAKPV